MECILGLPKNKLCGNYKCKRCLGVSFAGNGDITKIKAWDYNKNECKSCIRSFEMKVIDASIRDIICEICLWRKLCKKRKETKKIIKESKNIMSVKQYKCEDCDKNYQFSHQLKKHNKSVKHIAMLDGSAFKCKNYDKECDYETNTKFNLTMHILNNHSTVEERKKGFPFYCEPCDVGRGSEKELETHLKTKKHEKQIKKLS